MHIKQATPDLPQSPNQSESLHRLVGFIRENNPLFVLTGAGCSTESGIPDYRDTNGEWKHARPVQYQEFVQHYTMRQRYWARSMVGYHRIANAIPNYAHQTLAELEHRSFVSFLVTQNVDGLHQKAGQRNVVELHGSLAMVRCLNCDYRYQRKQIQSTLAELNPSFRQYCADAAPDGDAQLEQANLAGFGVPDCVRCGGILKPDVVFFGESVPKERVTSAFSSLQRARGMVIVGTSLFIYSGYRFVRFASDNNIPIAAINLGATRADKDFAIKLEQNCAEVLYKLLHYLVQSEQ